MPPTTCPYREEKARSMQWHRLPNLCLCIATNKSSGPSLSGQTQGPVLPNAYSLLLAALSFTIFIPSAILISLAALIPVPSSLYQRPSSSQVRTSPSKGRW